MFQQPNAIQILKVQRVLSGLPVNQFYDLFYFSGVGSIFSTYSIINLSEYQ